MANIVFQRGVHLPDLGLWLDARSKRSSALISHAHTDHVGRHEHPIATRATSRLLHPVLNGRGRTLEFGEVVEAPGYRLSLHPSAHCLGAAQVLVEVKATGERVLYTGDLKLRPNATAHATQVVPCDTLVLDATYGAPRYRFPDDAETLARLRALVTSWLEQGYTPVVMAYRVGKAQEALHHLLAWGFPVAVHPAVYEMARAYEELEVVFPGRYRLLDGQAGDGEVVLCPPQRRDSQALAGLRRVRSVFLTGWAVDGQPWWSGAHTTLPLSDHCDYDDLLAYVRQSGARRVLTVFGGQELAAHLRRQGYDAHHLPDLGNGATLAQQLQLL